MLGRVMVLISAGRQYDDAIWKPLRIELEFTLIRVTEESPTMADDQPDVEDVGKRAQERRRERAKSAERMSAALGAEFFDEYKYPATSEELATEYGDQEIDLANETETVGDVFDRLVDERFESADEVREAVFNELTGEASGREEYNDERALSDLDDEEPSGRPPE